jgi:hypothetical protein
MIVDRRAHGRWSDCRETVPGSGAALHHATLRAAIEAATRQAEATLGNRHRPEKWGIIPPKDSGLTPAFEEEQTTFARSEVIRCWTQTGLRAALV